MGLFAKKIRGEAARDLCAQWYRNIVSEKEMASHRGQLQKIKEVFPLLADVRQEIFDRELTAVNIQWLDIAWTKYYTKKHVDMMAGIDFIERVKALVPEISKYDEIGSLYNQAFGSSHTAGNTVMAELFVSRIMEDFAGTMKRHGEEVNQIISGNSYLFSKTFDIYSNMIERAHLIG